MSTNGSRDAPDCPAHGKHVQTGSHSGDCSIPIPGDTGASCSRAWLGGGAARGSLERHRCFLQPRKCVLTLCFTFFPFEISCSSYQSPCTFFFFFLRPWVKLTGFSIFSSSIRLTLVFLALTKQHSSQVDVDKRLKSWENSWGLNKALWLIFFFP